MFFFLFLLTVFGLLILSGIILFVILDVLSRIENGYGFIRQYQEIKNLPDIWIIEYTDGQIERIYPEDQS